MKIRNKQILLALFMIIVYSNSYADVAVFDTIVNGFATPTSRWQYIILPMAEKLFWTISFIEFTYQAAFKKLLPGEIQKLWVWVITRCVIISLFARLVLDVNVYTGLIAWLIKLGSELGGVNLSGGDGMIAYSVSGLWDTLWNFWSPTIGALIVSASTAGVLSAAVGNFLFSIATAILVVMLSMVCTVIVTIVQSYFVVFGGLFLVAFAGSSWTKSYWEKYLSYIVALGIRLMFTALVLGVLQKQWADTAQWLKPITISVDALPDILNNLVAMLGVFVIDLIALVTFPMGAAAMLNGTLSAGLGETIGAASMAMSGGKAMSSGAKGVAGLAKNLASKSPLGGKVAALRAVTGGGGSGGGVSKFRESLKQAKKSGSNFAKHAGAGDSNSSGGSINVNPHE